MKDDYVYDALKKYGFEIYIPYKQKNLFMRILRELWFKLHLPKRSIWFNPQILESNANVFIVFDPLVVPELLEWIKKRHSGARVILNYENRADSTISPSSVSNGIEKWSYDKGDCEKYGMRFVKPSYYDIYSFDSCNNQEKEIDILYLGRDKGRLNQILNYQKLFEKQGLSTYFHICADRSYMILKKRIYKPVIRYGEYLELLKKSKAILNIARLDQDAVTQRELEVVFLNVKCITTNKSILCSELYDKSRYFVVGEDDIESLNEFLKTPFKPVSEEVLHSFSCCSRIKEMLSN